MNKELSINIDWNSWDTPFIFDLIKNKGDVPVEDMRRSFNLGIGMILIVNKTEVDTFTEHLKERNETFSIIGELV